jgi:hypothetical protein
MGMKIFSCALLLFFSVAVKAQSIQRTVPSQQVTLQDASTIRLVPANAAAVTAQATAWKKKLSGQLNDATAWLNYYVWTSRNTTISPAALAEIVTESQHYISSTAEYQLMRYLQSDRQDSSAMLTAIQLKPDNAVVCSYAVQYALIHQNKTLLKAYCQQLERLEPMEDGIKEYHTNVLLSAAPGANVYAKGLYDLVPMAVLQQVYSIRNDVQLMFYTDTVQGNNNYLCLSLGKQTLLRYSNACYTGLLLQPDCSANTGGNNTVAAFNLYWLNTATSLSPAMAELYKNYLPSFIAQYKQLAKANSPAAVQWKEKIDKIATAAGISSQVNSLITQP